MTGTAHGILNDQYGRFHLETWIDAEGMAFRDSFVRVIMRYWDAKCELTPNQPWYRPSGSQMAAERPGSLAAFLSGWWTRPNRQTINITSSSPRRPPSAPSPHRSSDLGYSPTATSPSIGTPD